MLESRRLGPWLAAVGVALGLPSLRHGLVFDDRWHRASVLHDATWLPKFQGPASLFTFATGDPAETRWIFESGYTPWWSSPALKMSFFRPIPSLTHAFDCTLFPNAPWLMHAHSLAWYAALVLVVTALFRRLFAEPWIAGLAAAIYAVDHTHGLPVGWIANRNAVICATFAAAAILVFAGPKTTSRSLLSAGLFALALGSGEGALGAAAYLACYTYFLDGRSTRDRLLSLAPHAVVLVAWAIVYRAGGYGVVGSGAYFDPLHEPVAFLGALIAHLPLLLACELGGFAPDLHAFMPGPAKVAFVAIALGVLVWSARALARSLRSSPLARFFAASAILATIPACGTFASARLLMVSGIGLVGLVAIAGAAAIEGVATTLSLRTFAAWACGGHLLISPLAFQVTLAQMPLVWRVFERLSAGVPSGPEAKNQRLILVNAPDAAFSYHLLVVRLEAGDEVPRAMAILAPGARDVRITRTAERALTVSVDEGFYRRGTDLLFRKLGDSMPVGTSVALGNVTMTVTHTLADGVPDEARFDFAEPLDGGAFAFRRWTGEAIAPFTPPAMGESVAIPGRLMDLY